MLGLAVFPLADDFWFCSLFRVIFTDEYGGTACLLPGACHNFPPESFFISGNGFAINVKGPDGLFFIEVDIFLLTLLFKFDDDGISFALHVSDECAGHYHEELILYYGMAYF